MAEESGRQSPREPGRLVEPPVHVGRRTVLGILGLAGIGIAAGAKIDDAFGSSISAVSSAIGVPLPGDDAFRYYTITGTYPVISPRDLRTHRGRHGPRTSPPKHQRASRHEADQARPPVPVRHGLDRSQCALGRGALVGPIGAGGGDLKGDRPQVLSPPTALTPRASRSTRRIFPTS